MPKPIRSAFFPLRLSEEVDRLFQEMIHRRWGISREPQGWNPSIDLYETPDAFVLEADLPGVKREDIQVEAEGRLVTVRGRRAFNEIYSDGRFHYQERGCGDFLRRLTLPETVNEDGVEVTFESGVLRVVLPKLKVGNKRQ